MQDEPEKRKLEDNCSDSKNRRHGTDIRDIDKKQNFQNPSIR